MSLFAEDEIGIEEKRFTPYDMAKLKMATDQEKLPSDIFKDEENKRISIKQILDEPEFDKPINFKVITAEEIAYQDENEQANLLAESKNENVRFVRVKTKNCLYQGFPAIALFINDKTKKVRSLIDQIALQEERIKR